MLPNESVVLVVSTLSQFIVTTTRHITEQEANKPALIQWLLDNEGRVNKEDFPSLVDLFSLRCDYDTSSEYCNGMTDLLIADGSHLYAEWLASGNSPCDPREWYRKTILRAACDFITPAYQLSGTWENLSSIVLASSRQDLSSSSIDDLRQLVEGDDDYAYEWSDSDFASINRSERSINQAVAVFAKLVKDYEQLDDDCLEIRMLARWHQGEDLLYVKLEC